MGSKSSRHLSETNELLSRETIDELCTSTGFSEDELLTWHTNFHKDCPDGRLTLKQFEHEYSKIMGKPTQKTMEYVKHMFNVYDKDKNQFIDFREFVTALSAASTTNRLRLVETLFSIFDLDADGRISKDELGKMLHSLVEVTTTNRKHRHNHRSNQNDEAKQHNLQKRIDDAFNELNGDDDEFITKNEFIDWYIRSGLLTDHKSSEINIPDTLLIQEIDKKNRKNKRLQNREDIGQSHVPLQRYMSHMTEKKSHANLDENNDLNDTFEQDDRQSDMIISDDSDSHYSLENERWQHLFNSVLQQIRVQHSQNQGGGMTVDDFHSWKQQGEEQLKLEYYRQKTNDYSKSPEIVRIRL